MRAVCCIYLSLSRTYAVESYEIKIKKSSFVGMGDNEKGAQWERNVTFAKNELKSPVTSFTLFID